MATYKVYNGSSAPASPWDTFATNAAQSISALITAVAAGPGWVEGDTILVAHDHDAGYSGNTTLNFPVGVSVISVNRADPTAYLAATGDCETTANGHFTLKSSVTAGLQFDIRGLKFGVTSGSSYITYIEGNYFSTYYLHDCYVYGGAHSASKIQLQTNARVIATNTAFSFLDAASNRFQFSGQNFLHLQNCTFPATAAGTAYLLGGTSTHGYTNRIFIEDCDLSKFAIIADVTINAYDVLLQKVLLKSGYALTTGTLKPGDKIVAEECSDGQIAAIPKGLFDSVTSAGNVTFQSAIYREGYDGEQNWAYKFASGANCDPRRPLVLPNRMAKWHDGTPDQTLTVYVLCDEAALTDAQAGLKVSWNDEAAPAYPTGEFVITRADYVGAAAGTSTYLKTDATAWTGQTTETAYKFQVAGISPTEPGWIHIEPWFGVPSSNFYVCPNMILS